MKARPKTIFVTIRIKALTFIELLIVIIIMGILMGVSIPQFRKTFNQFQLNSFSRDLQSFMNFLQQRSIVEQKIISLNIDNEHKEYWAQIRDTEARLKTYPIPQEIEIEVENKEIIFQPDGQITPVTLKLKNPNGQNITLTTRGVFAGVKIQSQE